MGLPQHRQFIEWKYTDNHIKKSSRNTAVIKEGNANSPLEHKGPITIDFLDKNGTIKTASYCQFLRQKSPYSSSDPYRIIYLKRKVNISTEEN